MNPAPFDLYDIEHEPTDEQLAALMDAVAEEARSRWHLARRELTASLSTAAATAMQATDPRERT
jgi:hypothetical protein